jgi:hypothetical protein
LAPRDVVAPGPVEAGPGACVSFGDARASTWLGVTRSGKAIARLEPLQRPPLHRSVLLERWRRLRFVDPDRIRADIGAVIDAVDDD